MAPLNIILRLEFLSGEEPLFAGDGRHGPPRPPNADPRNRAPPAGGAPLVDACHAKALLQLIVGAGQALDIVALEETGGEVVGDPTEMCDDLPERSQLSLLVLH